MINKLIVLFCFVLLNFPLYAQGGTAVFNTPLILLIVGVVITILGWLLNRSINNMDEKIDEIRVDTNKNTEKINEFNEKLNDVNVEILKEVNAISVKIAEFKRDSPNVK